MEVKKSDYSTEVLRYKLQELYRVHDSLVFILGFIDRERYHVLFGEKWFSIYRDVIKYFGTVISEFESEIMLRDPKRFNTDKNEQK